MKFNTIVYTITLLVIMTANTANARPAEIVKNVHNNLPSSPIINSHPKKLNNDPLLSCKTDSETIEQIISTPASAIQIDKLFPESLKYMNDAVKIGYNKMRNEVIKHVTMKVAMALFNFSIDGFAAENIATYVSDGTKPFLPFEFANGVRITKVTAKGGTIVYRAEMPITKNHSHAAPLALAGRVSATTTVCNDMQMVDDLLGRDVVIQYDYYDANGIFFSSFTING